MKTIPTLVRVLMVLMLLVTGCAAPEEAARADTPIKENQPVLLLAIGVHVEPFGARVSSLVGPEGDRSPSRNQRLDYNRRALFERHVQALYDLADVVEKHQGKLVVQVQSPFTTAAQRFDSPILKDLEARGHEIGLHFHEDAHLGPNSERLAPETWCAVMKEEIGWIHDAGVTSPVRYWSGGNLYPNLLTAASCAGLDVNGDWKNPRTQQTDEHLLGVHPWRPAGGPNADDLTQFATHDPSGPVVFLPQGQIDPGAFGSKRQIIAEGGPEAWFDVIGKALEASLAAAQPDRVNVFHFTVHPGEFSPDVIDHFLTTVVDPLVAEGRVRWATYSEMADAFRTWEETHPGEDPRSDAPTTAPQACRAYVSFIINVHDFKNVEDSADTLLRLTDLFEKYGVRGDFYVTAPIVHFYADERPDVLTRLRESDMTISYHVRPPHPVYGGFDQRLRGLDRESLAALLRDYETYRLDMATGDVLRDQPGGYTYVKQVFGRPPVTVSVPNERYRDVALPLLSDMGARMTVIYHESGTDPDNPFEWRAGLLVRPSDFSVTRWSVPGGPQNAFWWNHIIGPYADDFDPLAYLQEQLSQWTYPRPPFVTVLIHENNFYRRGATPWALVYYEDANKRRPKSPPFDLNAPDPSHPRPADQRDAIWQAYEQLVSYAADQLCVVTSEDIVRMAAPTQVYLPALWASP